MTKRVQATANANHLLTFAQMLHDIKVGYSETARLAAYEAALRWAIAQLTPKRSKARRL